jgi:hypothetical protein
VSTSPPESFQPFLTDDEALSWFVSRRGGGFLYNQHMSFITEIFGRDISTRHRAAVDPSTGEPTVLIIEIMRSSDDDESWRQLIQVQAQLLERAPDYSALLRLKEPFRRIILTLSDGRSSWLDLVARLEREE